MDSSLYETRCDQIKAEYLFKKELLENISSDRKTTLNPEFVKKYDLTFEKLESILTQYNRLKATDKMEEPCEYTLKLAEKSEEVELFIRVIKTNRNSH